MFSVVKIEESGRVGIKDLATGEIFRSFSPTSSVMSIPISPFCAEPYVEIDSVEDGKYRLVLSKVQETQIEPDPAIPFAGNLNQLTELLSRDFFSESSSLGSVTISGQPISVTLPTGTNTPTFTNATSNGTIAAGAKRVSFYNSGTTDATVLGGVLQPGFSVDFVSEEGKSLDAINYECTATSQLDIAVIT